jgi:hypothetical protein
MPPAEAPPGLPAVPLSAFLAPVLVARFSVSFLHKRVLMRIVNGPRVTAITEALAATC